jgi:predicted  nucleic acid-binding Zn-ribbon protein
VSAFERVGGNAINTPTQARERGSVTAPDLKPGTTMARIADLEKGVEAMRGALGRARADYRELAKRVAQLEAEREDAAGTPAELAEAAR